MRDFALEVFFSKWEFAARYNLAGSDGENMTLAELLALASPELDVVGITTVAGGQWAAWSTFPVDPIS